MKNLYFLSFLVFLFMTQVSIGQSQLQGKVTDAITGEPILIGTVALYKDNALIRGTDTDFDGNYFFSDIDPGNYDVEVSYVGYEMRRIAEVIVIQNKVTKVDIQLSEGIITEEVCIINCKVSLVEFNCATKGSALTPEDIMALPTKSIANMAAPSAGIPVSADGDISIRGSRTNATFYYIDGIRLDATESNESLPVTNVASLASRCCSVVGTETMKDVRKTKRKKFINKIKDKFRLKNVSVEKEEILLGSIKEVESILPEEEIVLPTSGQLTGAEWNDLNNWEDWNALSSDGVYQSMSEFWGMDLGLRYAVFVTNEQNIPVPNCEVILEDTDSNILWSAMSDNAGRAELWLRGKSVEVVKSIRVKQGSLEKVYSQPKTSQEGSNHIIINTVCKEYNKVDIMFVVDVTSSMDDEINFLRAELRDVIEQSTTQLEDSVEIRLGSVFYKDINDDYVTAVSPLDSDINKTMTFIGSKNAGGGGDTPEAVDAGLAAALEQDWDNEAVSRLVFLVLDAPPHHNEEVLKRLSNQIREAAQRGIKIIPITASGLDRETEYLMKTMSIATNGTYVFLTDDSEIGNAHLTPVVSDYEVELLNDLLVRLISSYSMHESCKEDRQIISENIRVYPNPTSQYLTVDFNGSIDELIVSSSNGKGIKYFANTSSGLKIDLSDMVSGMYYVTLKSDGISVGHESVVKI